MTTPFSTAFLAAEDALGQSIGYPALVYQVERADDAHDLIADLRTQLDQARGHVEALVGAIERERTAQDAHLRAEDDETLWDDYEDACASTIIVENAARAFLRGA
jgi:hypothetical protein